jgi:hypothetical protein
MDFESIEIRKAKNGFVIVINTDDSSDEYVTDSSRKAIKMIRDYVDTKTAVEAD